MGRAGQQVVRDEDGLEDRISVGLLARAFPRATVEAVIEASGAREQRVRMLPSWLVVYYVLALALFMDMGGGRVMRKLAGTLSGRSGARGGVAFGGGTEPGPGPVGAGPVAVVVRVGRWPVGVPGYCGRFLAGPAGAQRGWHHLGCAGHRGELGPLRGAGYPRRVRRRVARRVPQGPGGGFGRVRHEGVDRRTAGQLRHLPEGADGGAPSPAGGCLLYTSDAADDLTRVDL